MERKTGGQLLRLGITVGLLSVTLSAALGCGFRRSAPSDEFQSLDPATGASIQPLAIDPYTDPLQTVKIDEKHSLLISPTDIFVQEGDAFYPILVHGSPLMVGLSPNGKNFAFIEPAAFELLGDLYVFKVAGKSLQRLTNNEVGGELSVKAARWADDKTLYYIEGYAFGTVSNGGSLYRIKANGTGREQIFAQSPPDTFPHVEVVDFEFTPDHFIRLELEVFDEDNDHSRQEVRYLDIDEELRFPEKYSVRELNLEFTPDRLD